jgi:hypothetical protein
MPGTKTPNTAKTRAKEPPVANRILLLLFFSNSFLASTTVISLEMGCDFLSSGMFIPTQKWFKAANINKNVIFAALF